MSHGAEVLADLVDRLRRDPSVNELRRPADPHALLAANKGSVVHVVDRGDLEILIASTTRCPPLELDRWATEVLCGGRDS